MTLQSRIDTVFREVLDDETLSLEDDVAPAGLPGWDSLAHVNALFVLEQEFGVQFGVQEFESLETVGDLKECLRGKGVSDG